MNKVQQIANTLIELKKRAVSEKEIIEKYGMTQQELADKLGISRSGIANTMRILNLDPRVIDLAMQGKLTEAHCKVLLSTEDKDKQYAMALSIIERGDNVAQTMKKMKIKKKDLLLSQY